MIVVDASAVVEYLFLTSSGRRVAERIGDPEEELAAPELIDVEAANAVRGWTRAGLIDERRAGKAIEHLGNLNALRWPHAPLLPRIWALHRNLTSYDAAYVALAESLRAPLLTCDASIARAPGITCEVELVG